MTAIHPTRWTRQHLDHLTNDVATTAPTVDPRTTPRILPDDDIWDLWPVQESDGSPSIVDGDEWWMALSAPAVGHPEDRHDHARLRLLARTSRGWRDHGHLFPEGTSPGSREWSGSAVRRCDGTVCVFYTAAGNHGEARPTFRQRVIEARVPTDNGRIRPSHNDQHREVVRPDGQTYLFADEINGAPGRIRAFRDPAWFRDPTDGREYLLIAASIPWRDRFMGAVAIAAAAADRFQLLPPLLVAEGINHELERPHLIVHDSWYYLFFTTQRHAFHPPDSAPTGLYGFAAPHLTGPYQPLNRSGLVIRNPTTAPDQAYAWLVLSDLRAISFLNYRPTGGADAQRADATLARAHFGGTAAPTLQLNLDRTRSSLTHDTVQEASN